MKNNSFIIAHVLTTLKLQTLTAWYLLDNKMRMLVLIIKTIEEMFGSWAQEDVLL